MKDNDRQLVDEFELVEKGIKAKDCDYCEKGRYVFQRVLNAKDVPYSIVVCKRCGFEVFSLETVKESQLIEYAKEQFGAFVEESGNNDE